MLENILSYHRFAAVVWGCIISVIALKSLSLIVQVVIQVVVLPYYQLVFSPASNFEDYFSPWLGLAGGRARAGHVVASPFI